MDVLLHQIGDLVLGSIPTLILFIVLLLAYRFILYGRLMEVREERRARTAGAVEQSRLAMAQADLRSQEYEARLRAARADLMRRREQRIQQWNAERERSLATARVAAQEKTRAAQLAVEAQTAEARRQIEATAPELATRVLAAVLPAPAAESAQ
ncbi:MAG: ATP synthase F0 subunit B [Acidobacteriaceae bacterium]